MTLKDVAVEQCLAHLACLQGDVRLAKAIHVVDQLRDGVQGVTLNHFLSATPTSMNNLSPETLTDKQGNYASESRQKSASLGT